jgi:hypothetical protein
MSAFLKAMKIFLLWICMPLLLGAVFVIAPCYTLGEFLHQERLWCGYKSGPPYMGAQFTVGIAAGLVLACLVSWKTHWIARKLK